MGKIFSSTGNGTASPDSFIVVSWLVTEGGVVAAGVDAAGGAARGTGAGNIVPAAGAPGVAARAGIPQGGSASRHARAAPGDSTFRTGLIEPPWLPAVRARLFLGRGARRATRVRDAATRDRPWPPCRGDTSVALLIQRAALAQRQVEGFRTSIRRRCSRDGDPVPRRGSPDPASPGGGAPLPWPTWRRVVRCVVRCVPGRPGSGRPTDPRGAWRRTAGGGGRLRGASAGGAGGGRRRGPGGHAGRRRRLRVHRSRDVAGPLAPGAGAATRLVRPRREADRAGHAGGRGGARDQQSPDGDVAVDGGATRARDPAVHRLRPGGRAAAPAGHRQPRRAAAAAAR